MADEQSTTNVEQIPPGADEAAGALLLDVDETAGRLSEIASQSLDSTEVARQIEELTSVVLDSAEVSTRSASIAADVSATMRAVVSKIQENNRRNVLHSRIMLGSFVVCLLIVMGVFFGVTVKMAKSIKELDTMIYAMSKRVIEVDASLTAISKTHSDFAGITEKQEEMTETQARLAKRMDEVGRALSGMPALMSEQSGKASDPKFQLMLKQLQTLDTRLGGFDGKFQALDTRMGGLEGKLQSSDAKMGEVDNKLQTVAKFQTAGPNLQTVLQEITKLKQEMEAFNQKTQQATERALNKANEKAEAAMAAANKAAASEKAVSAERLAAQRAAAEQAALERSSGERARLAAQRAEAERAAAEKAAAQKAAAQKAAAQKAAEKAAADKAAAEKAAAEKAAAEKAAAERERVRVREQAPASDSKLQYPRVPDTPR